MRKQILIVGLCSHGRIVLTEAINSLGTDVVLVDDLDGLPMTAYKSQAPEVFEIKTIPNHYNGFNNRFGKGDRKKNKSNFNKKYRR